MDLLSIDASLADASLGPAATVFGPPGDNAPSLRRHILENVDQETR
jgi:hypothetical protein